MNMARADKHTKYLYLPYYALYDIDTFLSENIYLSKYSLLFKKNLQKSSRITWKCKYLM